MEWIGHVKKSQNSQAIELIIKKKKIFKARYINS